MAQWQMHLNQVVPASSDDTEQAFEWLKALIALFKTAPHAYTTRGSSLAGSVTAHSATPDGVDRWATATRAQAVSNSDYIWNVLQSPLGMQLLFLLKGNASTSGAAEIFIGIAKNKFETPGAWRSAVDEVTWPRDITSSPERDRDIIIDDSDPYADAFFNAASQRFHFWKRTDAEGFYVVITRTDGASTDSGISFGGVAKLNEPRTGDSNPYLVWLSQLGGADWSTWNDAGPTHSPIFGRVPSVGTVRYSMVEPIVASDRVWDEIAEDPFSGLFQALKIAVFTKAVGVQPHVRGFFPDLYRAYPDHSTHDFSNLGKTGIIFGDFILPWDGVTVPKFSV